MIGFLIRALVSALGLWLADRLLDGISIDTVQTLLIAGLLLGIINAIIRPVFFFLTLPLTIVTLGLFILVVNGAMLGLVGFILKGVRVDGFWPAVLGALVISLISWAASWFIGGDGKARRAPRD